MKDHCAPHPGMADSGQPLFPLPEVQRLLKPYIKTRQEALRIRQCLAGHLSEQLDLPDTLRSSNLNSITLASDLPSVKSGVPELSGLRGAYLTALRANVKARKEYAALVAAPTQLDDCSVVASARSDGTDAEALQIQLSLLGQRQSLDKLAVLHKYMKILTSEAAIDSIDKDPREILQDLPAPPDPPLFEGSSYGPSLQPDVEALLGRLERAVLRAKQMHDVEKVRLEVVRTATKPHGGSEDDSKMAASKQLHALSCTRSELIRWIEGELGKAPSSPEPSSFPKTPPEDSSRSTIGPEQIRSQYSDYVRARASLLAVISAKLPSSTRNQAKGHPTQLSVPDIDNASLTQANQWTNTLLPHLTHSFIPTVNQQRDLIQQRSHLMTSLSKQDLARTGVLDRLADESHLLRSYPLLSAQPRFQNAVNALAPPQQRSAGKALTINEYPIHDKTPAWVFASDAAGATTHDHVSERVRNGRQSLSEAERLLAVVRRTLGHDPLASNHADSSGDITKKLDEATSTVQVDNTAIHQSVDLTKSRDDGGKQDGLWRGLRIQQTSQDHLALSRRLP